MSLESLWTRWYDARDVFDADPDKATTILLSLAEENLPYELYVRTYILLASATSDWFKAEEYLKTAEEMWGAIRTMFAIRSPENETIVKLRKELDELRKWQREDMPSVVANMMHGTTREEAEQWEREDALEQADPEFQAHVRRLEALAAGEGEADGEGTGESAEGGAGRTSELPIRGRSA